MSTSPVICVGSGRCGTLSLAFMLLAHDQVQSVHHESIHDWVALSTAYAYDPPRWEADVRKVADAAYRHRQPISVEADFKLAPVLSVVADELPDARFVWLTRNGPDTVRSMTRQGWYTDEDFGDEAGDYGRARLRGVELGVPEWWHLPFFERRCWYWGWINWTIHNQLSKLDEDRWLHVPIERVDQEGVDAVFDWIGPSDTRPVPHVGNRSLDRDRPTWSDSEREAFMRRCATAMDLLYPDWRDHTAALFGDDQ